MQSKFVIFLTALFLTAALPFNAAAEDPTDDIPTIAMNTGSHQALVDALVHADLVSTLQGSGPFTVFAPTDQAFADAGINLADFDTDAENQTLTDILLYHVVSGDVMSTDLTDALTTDAVNGDKLSFTVGTSEVKVNGATVTAADVDATNGVIHVIDKVLMPPVDIFVSDGSMDSPYFQFYSDDAGTTSVTELDISKAYKFQRLSNPSAHPFYVGDSGYNTDSSDNLIIAGDGTSSTGISDSESFTVFFRDGFSVDDTFSYFCTVHSSMFADFSLTEPSSLVDIPTVAANTGIHNSLVAALAHANLVSTLEGDGPFTIFAPTDEAFTAAGIDLSTFDTPEENETLVDILLYHVLAGEVPSSAVTDGLTVTMFNGDEATFTVEPDSGTVLIGNVFGDAFVTGADVQASNGIIHVIDSVLSLPPDIVEAAQNTGVHDSLVAALTQANLVTTLEGDGPFTVFAPTNDAFTAAGIDLSNFNTDEEIAALSNILTYHVVSGSVMSSDLTDGMTATALNTDSLEFTVNSNGVMVNDANVTMADYKVTNGVIHVIDKVLMPPADEPVGPSCDVTVGIASSGYAFSPASISIEVGHTVCWEWEETESAHNVVEVDGLKSTTIVPNGINSGASSTNVQFSHTFTENTTFYYVCEPHMGMDMYGKVVVGTGGEVESTVTENKESEDTPGFLGVTVHAATLGALLFARINREEE